MYVSCMYGCAVQLPTPIMFVTREAEAKKSRIPKVADLSAPAIWSTEPMPVRGKSPGGLVFSHTA